MALGPRVRRRCQPEEGRNRRSGSSGRLFLVVLSIALAPLFSAPAFAQSASEDQYESAGEDHYEPLTGVIGGEAANDALEASEALGSTPSDAAVPPSRSEPEDGPAENGTADDEGPLQLARLPETGGVSPLWLGVLLVAGGLLVRGVAWRARAR
jgi:hypothetical protein